MVQKIVTLFPIGTSSPGSSSPSRPSVIGSTSGMIEEEPPRLAVFQADPCGLPPSAMPGPES